MIKRKFSFVSHAALFLIFSYSVAEYETGAPLPASDFGEVSVVASTVFPGEARRTVDEWGSTVVPQRQSSTPIKVALPLAKSTKPAAPVQSKQTEKQNRGKIQNEMEVDTVMDMEQQWRATPSSIKLRKEIVIRPQRSEAEVEEADIEADEIRYRTPPRKQDYINQSKQNAVAKMEREKQRKDRQMKDEHEEKRSRRKEKKLRKERKRREKEKKEKENEMSENDV